MTIATPNRVDYIGNGSTAVYSYTFKIFEATDLAVTKRDLAGVETLLAYPNDYAVSGVGLANGGTIRLTTGNLPLNFTLAIRRVVEIVQETDLRNQSSFFPEVHEDTFDYLTMIDQQQQDEINRSVRVGESFAGVDPMLPPPLPNALIAWNATATALTSLPQPTAVPGGSQSVAGNIDVSGNVNVGTDINVSGDIKIDGVPMSGPAGSSLMGFMNTGVNATGRTVETVLREIKRASDYTGATVGAQINAAIAAAAVSGGIVFIPAGMPAGEPNPFPDNVALFDFRGSLISQGFRFNLPPAAAGNIRCKLSFQDNFGTGTSALPFGSHSATFYTAAWVDNPNATNGTIAAINGSAFINSQTGPFAGALVGIEGEAFAGSLTAQACSDIRGGTFNCGVNGKSEVFRAASLVAQAPLNSNPGVAVIHTAIGLLVEGFAGVGDTANYPFWCTGLGVFDGILACGAAPLDFCGILSRHSTLVGGTQIGIFGAPTSTAAAVGAGVAGRCDTAAVVFNQTVNASLYAQQGIKGAGSTITLQAGLYIDNMTAGADNYGIYSLHTGYSFFSGPLQMPYLAFVSGAPTGPTGGRVLLGGAGVGTVGAAGTSAPLPSAPFIYLQVNYNGVMTQIPLYLSV